MPPLLLDDEEAVAVAVALQLASGLSGIEETSARTLAKLQKVLPHRLRPTVDAVQASVTAGPAVTDGTGEGAPVAPAVLAEIAAAIRDAEWLRFDYRSDPRVTEPYRLVNWQRRWYLVARDARTGAWETFRVDWMDLRAPTRRRFAPRGLDEDGYAEIVVREVASTGWSVHARITVLAPADEVLARINPAVGVVEPVDDHECVLVTGADSYEVIAVYIGMLGMDFRIDAPVELADRVRELGDRYRRAVDERQWAMRRALLLVAVGLWSRPGQRGLRAPACPSQRRRSADHARVHPRDQDACLDRAGIARSLQTSASRSPLTGALRTIDIDGRLTGIEPDRLAAFNDCLAEYPIEPIPSTPHDHYSRNLLYDYFADKLKPCLCVAGRPRHPAPHAAPVGLRRAAVRLGPVSDARARRGSLGELLELVGGVPRPPALSGRGLIPLRGRHPTVEYPEQAGSKLVTGGELPNISSVRCISTVGQSCDNGRPSCPLPAPMFVRDAVCAAAIKGETPRGGSRNQVRRSRSG